MTINWPTTPNVGDTIEGPRGEVWKWDGVKWVSVVSGGGGGGGGGWPALGVTDGSDAAPGYIGEYAETYFFTVTVGPIQNMPTYIATLALPAGDWEVSANSYFDIIGTVLYVRQFVTDDYYGAQYEDLMYAWSTSQSIQSWSFSHGPVRMNFDFPFQAAVQANIHSSASTSTATATGVLSARRVR